MYHQMAYNDELPDINTINAYDFNMLVAPSVRVIYQMGHYDQLQDINIIKMYHFIYEIHTLSIVFMYTDKYNSPCIY